MSREAFIFFMGVVVFFVPFLGIPNSWKEKVFIVAGVLLMIVGYSLRRTAFLRSIDGGNGERKTDAFVESHQAKESPRETSETGTESQSILS